MREIQKSPYEGFECAEVGEDCFEELRTLMHYTTGKRGRINPHTIELLGDSLALALCKAHYEIGKSGILYSANWREGKIRDSDFGWIPKRQLLLCLHEHRFARGSESTLQAVAKNLGCTQLVLEAMDTWNITKNYPNLLSTRGEDAFVFATQKASCYKCQIFVARAFATLHILNKTHQITQTLTRKIKECLAIMNKHVRPNPIKLARVVVQNSNSNNKNKQKQKHGVGHGKNKQQQQQQRTATGPTGRMRHGGRLHEERAGRQGPGDENNTHHGIERRGKDSSRGRSVRRRSGGGCGLCHRGRNDDQAAGVVE
mmetsp:Transcript_21310/g.46536  ORF Transcript_21310/g.46536 Transcript_21310/m.46536 type:complete len:313 (-) Transcript_21310:1934-2872(-)